MFKAGKDQRQQVLITSTGKDIRMQFLLNSVTSQISSFYLKNKYICIYKCIYCMHIIIQSLYIHFN